MSLTNFIKEEMIDMKEDPVLREDYYKGIINHFIHTVHNIWDPDRGSEILDEYYDKHSPFHIKIDGEKIKNEDKDMFSWFALGVFDYLHEGDSGDKGKEAVENIMDEWTNDFVYELEEDGIITEEERDKWGHYYYDLDEEEYDDE